MENALYEGIDKELAAKDAEIAALRTALGLAWGVIDDDEAEVSRQVAGESDRSRGLRAEARHAKDVANALLTSCTL